MRKLFSGNGYRVTGIAFLFLLFSVFSPFPAVFADEIKIRAIVTPIGSQSEKWGAAGLMVCVTGEKVEDGGCGESGKVEAIDARDTSKKVEIDNDDSGKLVFFVDKDNSHSFSADGSDWVYEVLGGGPMVEEGCVKLEGEGNCYLCNVECPAGYVDKGDVEVAMKTDEASICKLRVYPGTGDLRTKYYADSSTSTTSHAALIDKWSTCASAAYGSYFAWTSFYCDSWKGSGYCDYYTYSPAIPACSPDLNEDPPCTISGGGEIKNLKCWFYNMSMDRMCAAKFGDCKIGHSKAVCVKSYSHPNDTYSDVYDCRCVQTFKYCCPSTP